MKKALICLLALLLLAVLCACGENAEGTTTNFTLPPMQTTGTTPSAETTETTASTPEATLPPDGSETAKMRKARFGAAEYLAELPFSREGLVDMLVKYESFTKAEAEYGADNCGADWNTEAVRMAERYATSGAYSRKGLEKQLDFEGFSKKEAAYGVENAKVDWLAEADEVAAQQKGYNPAITKEALAKYMTDEGFTMAEIGRVLAEG